MGTVSDIWSAGIVFGSLLKTIIGADIVGLFGSPAIDTDYVHYAKLKMKKYIVANHENKKLCSALNLLLEMLAYDQKDRIDATKALQHPFLA